MTNVKPLNKNIQKNIFGGSLALPMNPLYVSKKACEIEATSLIVNGKVTGMTILGLAQEIYAHACCFYSASGQKVQKLLKRKKGSYKPLFTVYNCPHAVSGI